MFFYMQISKVQIFTIAFFDIKLKLIKSKDITLIMAIYVLCLAYLIESFIQFELIVSYIANIRQHKL
jgi:hypothetical protein